MAYTTINKSSDYFNIKLYTGTGSTNALTGVGFQPDWVWMKRRDGSGAHRLCDAVRGATKLLQSAATDAEQTGADTLTSFDSDGFTLGADAAPYNVNVNSQTMVAWCWRAGTTSGITTNGSTVITPSAYSFNATSGFSIVKYAGNGNTTTKVAHGLGAVPKMIIIKNLDDGSDNWKVYHVGIGNTTALQLDNTGATSGGSDNFYDTTPDTVNFTLGNHVSVNNNGENYIAYCFAEKTGFSKFGSYTGNGNADGAFIYTGFKPAFVMVKRSSDTGNWNMMDTTRSPFNVVGLAVSANTTNADDGGTFIDIVSNGFKQRSTSSNRNASGSTYVYMAFAEAPLVGSNNVPATAR